MRFVEEYRDGTLGRAVARELAAPSSTPAATTS